MTSFKHSLAALFVALAFVGCIAADVEEVVKPQTNSTKENSSRTGRIMHIFKPDHPRTGSATRHLQPQPQGMRARADRFPSSSGSIQQRFPVAYQRRPMRPQILRRVQNNLPMRREPPRYEVVKSSRFSHVKGAPHHGSSAPSGPYRPIAAVAGGPKTHPNALSQGAGLQSQGHHFKASPNFNGNVELRPQQPREQLKYSPFAISRGQQQSLNQREEFTLSSFKSQPNHEQKFSSQQHEHQFSYYPQPKPKTEPLLRLKPKIQRLKFEYPPERHAPSLLGFNKATAPSGYAVYEDPDQLQASDDYAPEAAGEEEARREAQEYLKFMSSNGYFLPKHDPNYKNIDVERDHLHPYDTHQTQQLQLQQHENYQLQPQRKEEQRFGNILYDDSNSAPHQRQYNSHYNQQAAPKSGSALFFEEHPSSGAASLGTVSRGNFDAGQNEFVVSSDGKKGIKHLVSAPLIPSSTSRAPASAVSSSSALTYQHFQLGSAGRNRTPEPVRFEFTERDAISAATYTHSPVITGQLRKSAQEVAAAGSHVARPSTPRTPTSIPATTRQTTALNYGDVVKPIHEGLDDPEDDDDMLEADANTYGRVPAHSSKASPPQQPTNEQKDTEDYCERICSNVLDDDEEIVCGSDGYMYTSEAQMECYASCLHIDVTIQSKGACSTR